MKDDLLQKPFDVQEYEFNLNDLNISEINFIRSLGYSGSSVPDPVAESIHNIIGYFHKEMKIRCGYKRFDSSMVKIFSSYFTIENLDFNCKKIIGKYLKGSESLVFLVCTLGDVFEKLLNSFGSNNDYLEMFLTDKLASEIVEASADKMEMIIEKNLEKESLKITNRYSPGYCGWDVSEQKKFFSLMPERFCGVTLSEGSMMIPIKSVSAVLGIGKDVQRKDYECSICDDEFCYKRKKYE
ncbi:MAG: vitamin B12 dependent-methionine synthase activation domain-containing protein [Ignavibacterium sp.]|nr:vitamin B12 dependent-methionine synthase activation domain-containing protein [Ignavibacterium sp.]